MRNRISSESRRCRQLGSSTKKHEAKPEIDKMLYVATINIKISLWADKIAATVRLLSVILCSQLDFLSCQLAYHWMIHFQAATVTQDEEVQLLGKSFGFRTQLSAERFQVFVLCWFFNVINLELESSTKIHLNTFKIRKKGREDWQRW